MNLLYNLAAVQPIHNAKFHGGGSYGEVVFWALLARLYSDAAIQNENFKMFCIYDGKKYLNTNIIFACEKYGIPLLDINENLPQEMIEKHKINTFYTPLYSLEKKWRMNVEKYVFTWHGVRALEMRYSRLGIAFAKTISRKVEALVRYRDFWKKFYYKPKYNSLANQIAKGEVQAMTVSEHSRASIKAFFPELMPAEIPVFYSPMAENEAHGSLVEDIESKNYFLLTSGARWEKNNLRAAMAFDELIPSLQTKQSQANFKMVITGVTDKKIYTKKLRHKDRFVFLNYVENEQLEFLHQNAYAFIFPSLNEGFGYPPVQSMRYGVPVAASGTTSIPEICGNAALYFDPYSVSEIKNRIIQLLDSKIYKDYSERAKHRYGEVRERQKEDLEKAVDFILGTEPVIKI
ncbi:MAG: glycosyltransferase [Fibrobacter sp.]|jgi:glycosyltransferase involved in cell wall biosynthesis|nr:glycosyltransferase [Fibrobacter sp.]